MSTEHRDMASTAREEPKNTEDLGIGDEPTADMSVANSHDSLKELIEKNIKWSQVVYHQNKAIKRRLTMMVAGNYIRLALILIPIILGAIYLPPFISDIKSRYESVTQNINGGTIDMSKLLQQFFGGPNSGQKNPAQGRK